MIEGLDPVIHAPKRLAAMAVLESARTATFASLRERLDVTESDLSKQMAALVREDYVTVVKSGHGRGGVTTYRISATGRAAYRRHRAALTALLTAGELATG